MCILYFTNSRVTNENEVLVRKVCFHVYADFFFLDLLIVVKIEVLPCPKSISNILDQCGELRGVHGGFLYQRLAVLHSGDASNMATSSL